MMTEIEASFTHSDEFLARHKCNNRGDRGRLVPSTFRLGDQQCIGPQLFGGSFQKARNFTASIVTSQ